MRVAIVVAAVTVALAALALGGCGDDEKSTDTGGGLATTRTARAPGPGANEKRERPKLGDRAIRETLVNVFESGDPGLACGRLVTARYVRDAYGSPDGCRAAQGRQSASRITQLDEVIVENATARATVRAKGGPYRGERLRVALVLERGTWKLDSLRSNVPAGP